MAGLLDGVLPAIYSAGNTAKRRLNGLLADPAGTMGLGVTRFAEDNNNLLNTMANAYPMAGDRTVLNTPKQNALARALLADKGAEMGMGAATVWHGSPHKFDKFDSSKIGTGEGAQAYGHGLYLAENPEVAGQYARILGTETQYKGAPLVTKKGDLVGTTGNSYLDDYLHAAEGSPSKARSDLLEASRYVKSGNPAAAKEYQQALADLRKVRGDITQASTGQTYKVDLPDEHIAKMLDWDKPLSQQHPDVQKALSMIDRDTWHPKGGDYDANELGQSIYQRLTNQSRDANITAGRNAKTTLGASQAQAAEDLRAFGVPGIRYLDGGSRGAGAGSSNYVVFPGNENLLQILERNGQPMNGLLK